MMIDFYWLKSFTEILQLFLSVLFLIYLSVKYERKSPIIFWLSLFFYFKLATDLYGILNYTSWISSLLTRPVLTIYRAAMGLFEVGMLTSWVLFVRSSEGLHAAHRKRHYLWWYLPTLSLFPINLILIQYFQSSLLGVFDLVKTLWIITLAYTIYITERWQLKVVICSMLVWNILWLFEVVLHQQVHLITEETSWSMFVTSEFILTLGLSYFLVQIIAFPKLLIFENPEDVLPKSLSAAIEIKLKNAFEKEKVYKEVSLSVTTLADKLNISVNDLSSYLNKVVKKNFNQYLIDHRIEESQRLLSDNTTSRMTIEQIMLTSGFNSKSVFNTAFKNKTGLTPSQFRKRNLTGIK